MIYLILSDDKLISKEEQYENMVYMGGELTPTRNRIK